MKLENGRPENTEGRLEKEMWNTKELITRLR